MAEMEQNQINIYYKSQCHTLSAISHGPRWRPNHLVNEHNSSSSSNKNNGNHNHCRHINMTAYTWHSSEPFLC